MINRLTFKTREACPECGELLIKSGTYDTRQRTGTEVYSCSNECGYVSKAEDVEEDVDED